MNIDWKRKLTSRKFWAAVAGFVSMILIYFGKSAGTAEQVAAIIMAGASLVAYMIGEGLADSGTVYSIPAPKTEDTDDDDPFCGLDCNDCKIEFEEDDDDGVS